MPIATLTIDLNAHLANIERDMGRAAHIAEQSAQRMQRAFSGAGTAIAALGGALSLGAFAALAKSSISSAAALDDLSESSGASVESLSKLVDIARISGKDITTVETSIAALNRSLQNPNADENKGVGAALNAIGLSAADLLKQDPAQRLETVAGALAKFADGADKGNVVFALFKKSVKEVVPFLNDINENLDRGASVTAEQARQAEALEKAFNRLGVEASNAGRGILLDMIPTIQRLISEFNDAHRAGIGFFDVIRIGVRNLSTDTAGQLKSLDSEIDRLGKKMGKPGLFSSPEEADRTRREEIDRLKRLREFFRLRDEAATKEGFDALSSGLPDIRPKPKFDPQGVGKVSKEIDIEAQRLDVLARLAKDAAKELEALAKAEEDYAKAIESIVGPAEHELRGIEAKLAAFGKSEGEINKAAAAELENAAAIAEMNGALPEHIELLKRMADVRLRLAEKSDELRIKELIAEGETEKLEKARREMLFLADALERGQITAEQFSEAATARLGLVASSVEKTKSLAEELGLTFTSAFEDAIAGGKGFADILKGIEADLLRLGTRKLVTEPLLKQFESLDFGSLVIDLFGAAKGAAFDRGRVMPFASGGIVNSPALFRFASGTGLMGESGPEAILPLKRGRDGKLGVSSGGGVSVVNNFHVSGDIDRRSQSQIATAAGLGVRRALARNT